MSTAIRRRLWAGLVITLWFAGIGIPHAAVPSAGDAAKTLTPRDPFQTPLSKGDPGPGPSALETYELHALTLVAVIWDSATPRAMVEDSAGIGYTIVIGTPIGISHGVVKEIDPDRVVVEESYKDLFGEEKTHVAVMKLRPDGMKTR
jgi:Tfp pilus assembly protein PilP